MAPKDQFKCGDCTHRTEMCKGIKKDPCLLYAEEQSLTKQYEELTRKQEEEAALK